jgi:TraM recognition site of TraD and TraG/Bacterial protein of unknown function (DUF853)
MNQSRDQTNPDPYAGPQAMKAALIPFALGALAGIAIAWILRLSRLSWTWAPCVGPLVLPVWVVDWQAGLFCATTVLTASGFGFYWSREMLQRGGTEARAEKERIGPLRFLLSRRTETRATEARVQGNELAIGTSRRGRVVRIPFGRDHGVHGVVLGATGGGKTVTQAAIAQAYIGAGMAAIVVDPKGDDYLRSVIADAARHAGTRFLEWSPSGTLVYNPFARGGATEIADKILAGHKWTEPHYELATQRLLGQTLAAMQAAGQWPPTLSQIVRFMDPERLDGLATEVGGEVAERVAGYVDGLSARAKSELGGGRDRIAVLGESEIGPRVDPSMGLGPELDLLAALQDGDVVLIRTESDRYPAASKLLGAALVIDLVSLTTVRGLPPSFTAIDEFGALAAEEIARLFSRARHAGMSLLLGTQSLADLRGARPNDPSDTLTEQVLSNIEYAICHRQGDPDSAERLAQVAGTDPTWATTRRVSGIGLSHAGEGTQTREREFMINPDEFKRLQTGEAVVIDPKSDPPAKIVRIWAPRRPDDT